MRQTSAATVGPESPPSVICTEFHQGSLLDLIVFLTHISHYPRNILACFQCSSQENEATKLKPEMKRAKR